MKSFEQRMLQDAQEDDDFDEDDYCVKTCQWIPGGCQVEVCEDIGKCPYLKETNLNKYN